MFLYTSLQKCQKNKILFELFINYLKQTGVKENHIISLNLESFEYNFNDYMELYNYVSDRIKDEDMYYVFLDEVEVIDTHFRVKEYIKKCVLKFEINSK